LQSNYCQRLPAAAERYVGRANHPIAAPPYFVIIALYAFASSAKVQVLCLAHVTNTMGQAGDDFEKGEADGTRDALTVLENLVSVFQT
jgi:hypothetical protein